MPENTDRLSTALADRYRIERHLGEGGMATVYLAHDLRHDRPVAVKVLRPELAAVLGAERFIQEIKTTANLQHPHILPLFDSGEADSFLYYVMPFIDGETLRDKLNRETQLGIDEAVGITTAIADALDYAHRNNVIHRDIKPENILLHDGRPMVADFGIALALSAAAGGRMTETGLSLGTPHYMSPEQATAEKEITHRSDIYSLASVLYEMLTGAPPHVGGSAQQIIMKIVTETPPPATQMRKSVPPNVAGAVAKALEKLPADRFESAKMFADALANPSFALGPATAIARHPDRSNRPRLATHGLSAGLAVAIGAAVWGWAGRPDAAPLQKARFAIVPDSSHVITALCCGSIHAISRDGRRIAYQGAARGLTQLYVRALDALEAMAVPGTRGGSSAFFSPDGDWIGFGTSTGRLMKVNVDGGAPIQVANSTPDLPISGATWTDDGFIIYSTQPVTTLGTQRSRDSSGLMIVPADGGDPQPLTIPDSVRGEHSHRLPFSIPGSNMVAFTVWPASRNIVDARIVMLDRGSGEITEVVRGTQPQVTSSGHLFVQLPSGEVTAQAFDWRTGRLSGPPHYVADSVYVSNNGGWGDYAVSWGGTLLYRVGSFEPSVTWVQPDGLARDVPIDIENVEHLDAPRISPDGGRLAFATSMSGAGGHRLHVMDLVRGTTLPLTLDGEAEQSAWTDDGDSLVIVRDRSRIVIRAADRSGIERVIIAPSSDSSGVLRSGDEITRVTGAGPWVAFARARSGGRDIVLTRRDSTGARAYLETAFNGYAPALSPNGRWLAYVTDETGRGEVYVGAFPVAGGRQPVSLDGGSEPVWAPDGRTLYYRDGRGDLVAVAVESEMRFNVGARRTFEMPASYELSVDGAEYDVSRTGEEFLMLPSGRSGSARLVIVLNVLAGT